MGNKFSTCQGKKNFTDLSKSPHGHSKKVHPKKSGRDSSRDLSAPVLIWTIRRLIKEKAELDSRTRRLETEKNELQLVLEKELDRRSSDWSLKLEKYQIEQHRLRERVRELVEQNVSLQREVSSFNEKKVDNRIKMSFSEKHLEDLFKRIEQVSEKNQNLRQKLTQLQAEYRVAQDNRDYVRENYHEKVKELKSKTLLKTVLREKLYSEEMDIKQLQPDLTTTVRVTRRGFGKFARSSDLILGQGHELSIVLKKDGNINQLTNDLEECMKELGIVKAILPKVFQERDFMWEEVKSYSEMNMLLNYEINMLKRKVDTLDEDFLMKQDWFYHFLLVSEIEVWFAYILPEYTSVHQNLTCSAAENVGTAAKPNGIMHEPVRADRPNAFNNNSSSVLSCIQTTVDIPSQIAGPSTFEFPDHALVRPGREGVRGSASWNSICWFTCSTSCVFYPVWSDSKGIKLAWGNNISCHDNPCGLESQGGDSSTSTSSNQQILDLNLALAFQKKLSDPRITSMLKRKGRHTDLELANLLQDEGLDPNFAVVLKENGLDPMILALL
ncbi:putative serine/arginine-rich splicing factor RS2Z33-like isoform X1 [Capsicum annuum]|nr:putative serine/arginine-rich splicing factor RS2Z33-like isoform X1 [Capsicum annuum]